MKTCPRWLHPLSWMDPTSRKQYAEPTQAKDGSPFGTATSPNPIPKMNIPSCDWMGSTLEEGGAGSTISQGSLLHPKLGFHTITTIKEEEGCGLLPNKVPFSSSETSKISLASCRLPFSQLENSWDGNFKSFSYCLLMEVWRIIPRKQGQWKTESWTQGESPTLEEETMRRKREPCRQWTPINCTVSGGTGIQTQACLILLSTFIKEQGRTSSVAQWLRICLPVQGTWVWSLVRELRSHMPQGS